jgi:hypothetical protein
MTLASRVTGPVVSFFVVAVITVLAGRLALDPVGLRIALTGCAVVAVAAAAVRRPVLMVYGLAAWLPVLGLVRRFATEIGGTGRIDPLLVIAPLMLVLACAAAIRGGALEHRTALTSAVLALSLLVGLESLNPLQGSLVSGLTGLLFILVPMLAFWVGRTLCDDALLTRVMKAVGAFAVGAALYGLAQTFVGFPAWDARWIRESGYTALNVGSTTRAFGPFSSSSEYALFLGIGLVVWLGFGLRSRRLAITAAVATLVAAGIFFDSSRGVVVMLVLAFTVLICTRAGIGLAPAFLATAVVALAIPLAVRVIAPASFGSSPGSQLAAHQVGGLSNPLDPNSSTLPLHLSLAGHSLASSLKNPAGLGIGAVTISGSKFGGVTSGAEIDPASAAVALGIFGVVAYLAVFVLAFDRAYRVTSFRRDRLALVALGVMTLTAFQWLNGGQYAVAWLPWLILGWFDRPDGAISE